MSNRFLNSIRSIEILCLLFFFLLYANSTAVVWMLYFIEQEDIAAFYCGNDSQSSSDGKSYVTKILEIEQSNKQSSRTVSVQTFDKTYLYINFLETQSPATKVTSFHDNHSPSDLLEGWTEQIFRPPLLIVQTVKFLQP